MKDKLVFSLEDNEDTWNTEIPKFPTNLQEDELYSIAMRGSEWNKLTNRKKDKTMDNQHKKIKGYRDFDQGTLDLINKVKGNAEEIGVLVESIRNTTGIDDKWLDDAELTLQKGFMSLIRSIAKPTTF